MAYNQSIVMNGKSVLYETIAVTAISLAGMLLLPTAKTAFALLPVVYLLIERQIRRRGWDELGLSLRTFGSALRDNRAVFVLLACVIQPVIVILAGSLYPAYVDHIKARLPFEVGSSWEPLIPLLPLLAVSLVAEELTYRALIQDRLVPHVGIAAAIGIASLLFGLAHFSPGPVWVVAIDIGLIMVDSILYGVMFARGHNLWVVWLAHLLGDVGGLLALTMTA